MRSGTATPTPIPPVWVNSTVYGLPELWADRIPGQKLIANPGCYTSASILGLAPLDQGGRYRSEGDHHRRQERRLRRGADAEARHALFRVQRGALGVLGRRQAPAPAGDRGGPLVEHAGQPVEVTFTPHLVPMDRGILATIYAPLTRPMKDARVAGRVPRVLCGKTLHADRRASPVDEGLRAHQLL